MAKLVIDSEKIVDACVKGAKFAITGEAEDELVMLLDLQDKIAEFVIQVKAELARKAVEKDKDFTGAMGDKIKVEYRAFGSTYALAKAGEYPDGFGITKTSISLDTAKVKEYEQENKKLPAGIIYAERQKQLVIKRI